MINKTFVGYSTNNAPTGKRVWELYDNELIKQDLLNHFHTRKGERVMRPEYGCEIWDYMMEPNIETNRNKIYNEANRIIGLESRVEKESIKLLFGDNTVIISCDLKFYPFITVTNFQIMFDKRQGV